jgi:hypothetical protein
MSLQLEKETLLAPARLLVRLGDELRALQPPVIADWPEPQHQWRDPKNRSSSCESGSEDAGGSVKRRRLVVERAVASAVVVVLRPVADHDPGLG